VNAEYDICSGSVYSSNWIDIVTIVQVYPQMSRSGRYLTVGISVCILDYVSNYITAFSRI
jgi:hypothetical protein